MSLEGVVQDFNTGSYRVDRQTAGLVMDGLYSRVAGFDQPVTLVDFTTDTLEIMAHGLETGYGPVWLHSDDVPAGLSVTQPYWVIAASDDLLQLAESAADAVSLIPIDFTTAGSGSMSLATHFFTNASIHDLEGRELQDLAEARRGQEIKVMFCLTEIKEEQPGYHADVVTIDGERWRVFKVARANVLATFWRAYLERLEIP